LHQAVDFQAGGVSQVGPPGIDDNCTKNNNRLLYDPAFVVLCMLRDCEGDW
jgi:hypothetical protein